jgi:MazG family protein
MTNLFNERKGPLPSSDPSTEAKFRKLLDLVARFRAPDGCPWDRAQHKEDVGRYLIEEAYEVLEALEKPTPGDLQEELGDLLFHILFLSRIAEEQGEFDIASVLDGITAKMIRRHPHVFGNAKAADAAAVRRNWDQIKREVEHKGLKAPRIADGLPRSLSTLAKAQHLTARASAAGFDWGNASEVIVKIEEELAEFRSAVTAGNRKAMGEEAGDLLFTVVNLCRFADADAEAALRASLEKFTRRFIYIEESLARRGKTPAESDLAEMDGFWNEAKSKEHKEEPDNR